MWVLRRKIKTFKMTIKFASKTRKVCFLDVKKWPQKWFLRVKNASFSDVKNGLPKCTQKWLQDVRKGQKIRFITLFIYLGKVVVLSVLPEHGVGVAQDDDVADAIGGEVEANTGSGWGKGVNTRQLHNVKFCEFYIYNISKVLNILSQ